MEPAIEHQSGDGRFVASLEGGHGRLDYRLSPGRMTIVHTEVDPGLQGRGVAGALVRAALDHARTSGLKVDAECPYARSYLDRHPETAPLRA
jgi:predicted GNAT family acetyltransferase